MLAKSGSSVGNVSSQYHNDELMSVEGQLCKTLRTVGCCMVKAMGPDCIPGYDLCIPFNHCMVQVITMYFILQGLRYIHSVNLVHLDIKPDNIFISSGRDAPGSYMNDPHDEDTSMQEDGEITRQFVYKIGKHCSYFAVYVCMHTSIQYYR